MAAQLVELGVLVGTWEVNSPQFPGPPGRTVVEWLADGAYLLLRDTVPEPGPSGTWVIGADDDEQGLTVLHHDERGVSRVYRSAFGGGYWRVWRDAPGFSQRFTATLDETGTTLRGAWETSADGARWEHDFDLIYRRIG
ncbi:hypothetical protein [Nocardia amikacinitolerans]|uniref:hypothetical protein n=1 Tax=Nocardia amikacinitolerans TaxID=756689 RepID=UPI0020A2377C|nr:hypothetical protein [Nocardia amikacinitolerans]MCP2280638.1 hypothetical protein [Nocardia amikacinitolerans]